MIYVIVTGTIKPEAHDKMVAGAQHFIAVTRKEAGCVSYDLHQSVTDPNKFVTVEQWESMSAIEAHNRSPHLQAFLKAASEWLSAPPKFEYITPKSVDVRSTIE